jgi:tRNA G37 N-methylase TrmD
VLTSGDHSNVDSWRRAEAERLTQKRRPDLWAVYQAHPNSAAPRVRGTRKGSPKR